MHTTVLKFLVWFLHEKIADKYFCSRQDNDPFLKKYGCNLVSKISKKTIEAGALKLDE